MPHRRAAVGPADPDEPLTHAGLRCAELCNLRPENVDLDTGTLRVTDGAKGGKQRELPIVSRLKTILTDYAQNVRPQLEGRCK